MTPEVLRYAAFTRDGAGGNPAGVVLDAGSLTDADQLAVAQAVGYSETAFVSTDEGTPGRLRVRYFSPRAEVAFCGHATIATAVAIAEREGVGELHLSTLAGPVTVTTDRTASGTSATLTSPPAHSRPATSEELDAVLDAFGWTEDDLADDHPAHIAFAGNHHAVIGARDEETLASLHYDFEALAAVMEHRAWTTVHVFHAESPTLFQARNPFPPGGVVEDPATGAAAAAFGAYLRTTGRVPVPGRFTVHQGHHMGAPSRLVVTLDEGTQRVRVTGAATRLTPSSSGTGARA